MSDRAAYPHSHPRFADARRRTAGLVALPRPRPAPARTMAGALVLALLLATVVPMPDPRLGPAPVDGQLFWELPTGSRIAYVRRQPAGGRVHAAPVVFVHGGPGVADRTRSRRPDHRMITRGSRSGPE